MLQSVNEKTERIGVECAGPDMRSNWKQVPARMQLIITHSQRPMTTNDETRVLCCELARPRPTVAAVLLAVYYILGKCFIGASSARDTLLPPSANLIGWFARSLHDSPFAARNVALTIWRQLAAHELLISWIGQTLIHFSFATVFFPSCHRSVRRVIKSEYFTQINIFHFNQ